MEDPHTSYEPEMDWNTKSLDAPTTSNQIPSSPLPQQPVSVVPTHRINPKSLLQDINLKHAPKLFSELTEIPNQL